MWVGDDSGGFGDDRGGFRDDGLGRLPSSEELLLVVARLDRAIQYSPSSPHEHWPGLLDSPALDVGRVGYWVARSSRAMTDVGFGSVNGSNLCGK
jgi:hypothetical protein